MTFKQAVQAIDAHAISILTEPGCNVKLLAVGTKDRRPLEGAKEFCVTAYVPEKMTHKQLKSHGIPQLCKLDLMAVSTATRAKDAGVGEIEFDVVESGSDFTPRQTLNVPAPQRGLYGGPPPTADTQKYFATLRCGIGITNPDGYPGELSVGTLGFFVRDNEKRVYLVSNSHVIGGSGAAKSKQPIVQPGTLDLTELELQLFKTPLQLTNTLKIAELTAVVPFLYHTDQPVPPINRVDAALAELVDPDSKSAPARGRSEIDRLCYAGCIVGQAKPYTPDKSGALLGSMRVYKVGRTTGFTEGQVLGVAGTGTINYSTGTAFFAGQIVVEGTADNGGIFSDRGDSGSAVLNDRHEIVGLLFAGSNLQTLVNPIADVVKSLRTTSGINSLQIVHL